MQNQYFVYVVCGSREYLESLHISIQFLQARTTKEIIIITDVDRNEIVIDFPNVVHVSTPKHLTNQQASIFLKTSVHRYLPKGNFYCYLDTDILALTTDIDTIFDQYQAPIIFAKDHFSIDYFSPYALNCQCLEEHQQNTDFITENLKQIDQIIATHQQQKTYFLRKIKYKLSPTFYHLQNRFYLHKETGEWYLDKKDKLDLNHMSTSKSYQVKCSHLRDEIKSILNKEIGDQWTHWNGGLFLFTDESHAFLELWHRLTLEKFELPTWKTRDQGSLIETIWSMELQNQATLDKEWNFLIPGNKTELHFFDSCKFTEDGGNTVQKVNFAHVYQRFGDTSWRIWNQLMQLK